MFIPVSCVMAQKKLSLACEIAVPPAPIASTVSTFQVSVSNPNTGISGAIIEAVVIKLL
jgi:hypothetical protein